MVAPLRLRHVSWSSAGRPVQKCPEHNELPVELLDEVTANCFAQLEITANLHRISTWFQLPYM